jgi:hypothetical protein
MNRKTCVLVCALAGVGLASLMGGLSATIDGEVALQTSDRVTAKAGTAQGIATRAAREMSGRFEVREPTDARLARSEPDTDLEDPAEVTLRASLEPVIGELAREEAMVSPDPEDTDDPEEITRRASLESVLEQRVDASPPVDIEHGVFASQRR